MEQLFLDKVKEVHLPDIIIFLESDPSVNMSRILKRGREGEANKIQQEYLQKLGHYYQAFKGILVQCYGNINVVFIETSDKNPEEVFSIAKNEILNFIAKKI